MMAVCAVATAATNLTMHLVLPGWVGSYGGWLLAGESLALFGEALAYGLASREHAWPRAMIASALANTASFLAGLAMWETLA